MSSRLTVLQSVSESTEGRLVGRGPFTTVRWRPNLASVATLIPLFLQSWERRNHSNPSKCQISNLEFGILERFWISQMSSWKLQKSQINRETTIWHFLSFFWKFENSRIVYCAFFSTKRHNSVVTTVDFHTTPLYRSRIVPRADIHGHHVLLFIVINLYFTMRRYCSQNELHIRSPTFCGTLQFSSLLVVHQTFCNTPSAWDPRSSTMGNHHRKSELHLRRTLEFLLTPNNPCDCFL